MGKLNIAHHKSYHPYRRDNIERVRRDEEEAQLKEAAAEGRTLLAVRDSAISTQPLVLIEMATRTGCRGTDRLAQESSWCLLQAKQTATRTRRREVA
jgi:hypothetical protein